MANQTHPLMLEFDLRISVFSSVSLCIRKWMQWRANECTENVWPPKTCVLIAHSNSGRFLSWHTSIPLISHVYNYLGNKVQRQDERAILTNITSRSELERNNAVGESSVSAVCIKRLDEWKEFSWHTLVWEATPKNYTTDWVQRRFPFQKD